MYANAHVSTTQVEPHDYPAEDGVEGLDDEPVSLQTFLRGYWHVGYVRHVLRFVSTAGLGIRIQTLILAEFLKAHVYYVFPLPTRVLDTSLLFQYKTCIYQFHN